MANGNDGQSRIEFLKQKEREIRAALAIEQVKRAKREKRETQNLESLMGRAALRRLDVLKDPVGGEPKEAEALTSSLKDALRTATLTERERKLLRAKGWL